MRDALTRRVDPFQAAVRGARVAGTLDAARLPRLAAVAAPVDVLEASLEFAPLEPVSRGRGSGAVRVTVRVAGNLRSTCQRCLEPVEFPAAVDAVVVVAPDDASADLAGQAEAVICGPGELLDPGALVEDEVLLALPFAPAHREGECAVRVDDGPGSTTGLEEAQPLARKDNPFAVLATLKVRDHDDN